MGKWLARCMLLACLSSLPLAAAAEPIKLKLSYYTSDREILYRTGVKPFVDHVNAEANGLLEIETFTSGSLGKSYPGQAKLVLDGIADIAFVNPALTPERFPDDTVIELPGLFNDVREASLTYTRLLAAGALRGYEDYFVIGAFGGGPQSIHTRAEVSSLVDLQGKKIRAANRTEAAVLKALGMAPVVVPINQTAEAMARGIVDGATAPPMILNDFGIARVANHHYFIRLGFAPIMILMNGRKFASLPPPGQHLVRRFGGEWLAAYFARVFEAENNVLTAQFNSDPRRTVVIPSPTDLEIAQTTFKALVQAWRDESPGNAALMASLKKEIARLRSTD